MATIALTRPVAPHCSSSGIASIASAISPDMDSRNSQSAQSPPSLPKSNKHLPVCPPGPIPANNASTPTSTSSPPSGGMSESCTQQSRLFPPDEYSHVEKGNLLLYSIDASGVVAALDFVSRQPLPDPSLVFPWFHGLHPSNQMQQAFFSQRHRPFRKTPSCLRGVTIVKVDGQLHKARLKGAIAPDEFLEPGPAAEFLEADPKQGFSVRNFQIQAAKIAMTSDIIVYGDDEATTEQLGWDIAAAQQRWREKHDRDDHILPVYNTFRCTSPFSVFEESYPEIVAVSADGRLTGSIIDFFHQERKEMYTMTMASEIAHNVWLGPTPEPHSEDANLYDVYIECSDLGHLNPRALRALAETETQPGQKIYLDFPSSGTILPPTWSQAEADAILETCKWIHHIAYGICPAPSSSASELMAGYDKEGDADADAGQLPESSGPPHVQPRRILIHCADGYTESTMLGIAYFSYSTGQPIPDAWLHLHTTMGRNFFAYPTDVALLTALARRLLCESPACANKDLETITAIVQSEPKWFAELDGSFPSRILDYMYLGNINHANNPELLKALGITRILSVGEMAMWRDSELEEWGEDNVCVVQGVQDNGIDPLVEEFGRCLGFIDRGRRNGTATLVHCRVGVSRSATICIAEVMRSMKLSFPQAYCFVRARRLNVIIQPHLRFAYELLKWEEMLQQEDDRAGIKRELEWGEIAREVALMNQPYVR